jgi:hypothetical protein
MADETQPKPVAFEIDGDYNAVELAVGDHLVRLEKGTPYETSDQHEILALDEHGFVRRADTKPAKASKADS